MLTFTTAANSSVQLGVDPTMRGRVMALYLVCFMGGTPLGRADRRLGGRRLRPALGAARRRARLRARRGRDRGAVLARRRGLTGDGPEPADRDRLALRPRHGRTMAGMHVIEVDDPADPRLDDFRDLDRRRRAAGPARHRDRRGRQRRRATGPLAVPDACRDRCAVAHRGAARTARAASTSPPTCVDKWVLSDVVGFRVTRGVLASATAPAPPDVADAAADGPADRGAGGRSTTSRTSARCSATRPRSAWTPCCSTRRCADPLYRRSVRVSMGHVLRVPFAVLPGAWPQSLRDAARRGVRPAGADPAAVGRTAERSSCRRRAGRCCWAPRGPGSPTAALAAGRLAGSGSRWPTGVDSLNVATAAAVAFAHLTSP